MTDIASRIAALDWVGLHAALDERGFAVTPPLLSESQCRDLVALYDRPEGFRSRVVMQRHGYGQGEYRYFQYPLPEPVPGPSEGLSLYDKTYAPPPKLSPNAALGHPSAPKGFVAYTDTDDAERASAPAHTRPIDSQKTFEVYGQYVTARVVGTGWLRLTTYGPSTHGAEVTEKSLEDIFHLSASRAEASLVFEWYTGAPRELPAGVHMARREGEWSIVNDGTVNHLFLEVEADGFVRAHGARFRLGGGGLDDLFCMAKKHVWAHLAVCWLGGLKA